MTPRVTLATASRVLTQLRRDPRTLALLLLVPVALLTLLKWVFDGQPLVFQRIGVPMIGIFPMVSMFLVTSVGMLRERTSGTIERLMTMPLAKVDLLLGYGIAFGLFAAIQVMAVAAVALTVLDLQVEGPAWMAVFSAVLNALLGMAFGLFLSAFASSEFQAVQFMPAFLLPQLLLCGLLAPRERMAEPLQAISTVLPMTYAYDALHRIAAQNQPGVEVWRDLAVVASITMLALLLGAASLRRRTP